MKNFKSFIEIVETLICAKNSFLQLHKNCAVSFVHIFLAKKSSSTRVRDFKGRKNGVKRYYMELVPIM